MNSVIILWVIRDVLIKTGLGVRSIKPMVIESNALIIILFQLATHFFYLTVKLLFYFSDLMENYSQFVSINFNKLLQKR